MGLMRNRFGATQPAPPPRKAADRRAERDNPLLRPGGPRRSGAGRPPGSPPFPSILQLLGGIFNGDNDVLFGYGKITQPLLTGRVRTFFDFEELGSSSSAPRWRSGTRWTAQQHGGGRDGATKTGCMAGRTPRHPRRRSGSISITFHHRGRRRRRRRRPRAPARELDPQQKAWYAYAEVQPWKRWLFGFRDTTGPSSPTAAATSGRSSPTWPSWPSDSSGPPGVQAHRSEQTRRLHENGASARIVDEILLQATFLLGAHPAHPFKLSMRSQGDRRCGVCSTSPSSPWPGSRSSRARRAPRTGSRWWRTTSDLKALTQAVGGDLVEVDALRPRERRIRMISRCVRA